MTRFIHKRSTPATVTVGQLKEELSHYSDELPVVFVNSKKRSSWFNRILTCHLPDPGKIQQNLVLGNEEC